MSTDKNYFDLIDSYLNGEMTSHEAIEFENQLQKDPLLENEFQLQKDIIKSVRNFRQAELKATLNAVDVGVGGSTFTFLKIAAAIGVIALVGVGVYYFTGSIGSQQPEQLRENSTAVVEKDQMNKPTTEAGTGISSQETDNQIAVNKDIGQKQQEPAVAEDYEEPVEQENQIVNSQDVTNRPQGITRSEQPEIKLPEVVEEFDKEEGQISENIKVPENKLNQVTETYLPKTEVVEMDHRRYAFHYQFYNNKLYLYGEFDNKYEILELNTPAGISIYMFYKGDFYELEQNQEKITPLNAIQDTTLIRDLKTIREN